ncbi:MAG: glycosyltransferase [Lachnospiraceae bacterium]|nr:glycosyltransferase [Lachnospiraceae bacterium]
MNFMRVTNSKEPKITYITVVYNREKTIENCIKSVLSQDYPNIEYIIIDGASSDNTMQIVNKYKDHIDCIVSEKDSGIYNAMNKGVRRATGDLICFMNSDDECLPGAATIVANTYKETHADIICGTRILCQDGKEVSEQTYTRFPIKHSCFRYIQMYHQSTYAARKLFTDIGSFDESYSLLADWIWESKAIDSGANVKFINDKLSLFNYDGASATGINKRDDEWIRWSREMFPVLDEKDSELFINCLDRGRTPQFNAQVLTEVAMKYSKCSEFIKCYYETLILSCIEDFESFRDIIEDTSIKPLMNRALGKNNSYEADLETLRDLLRISIESGEDDSLKQFYDNIKYVIEVHDGTIYSMNTISSLLLHKKFVKQALNGVKANLQALRKHFVWSWECKIKIITKRKNRKGIDYMKDFYNNNKRNYT